MYIYIKYTFLSILMVDQVAPIKTLLANGSCSLDLSLFVCKCLFCMSTSLCLH
jgi:hypothetical protein